MCPELCRPTARLHPTLRTRHPGPTTPPLAPGRVQDGLQTSTHHLQSTKQPGPSLSPWLLPLHAPTRCLRSALKTIRTKRRTWGDLGRAFSAAAPPLWNALPIHIRQAPALPIFKPSKRTSSNSLSPADPWPRYDPHSSSSLLSISMLPYILFVCFACFLFVLFCLSLVPCEASLCSRKALYKSKLLLLLNVLMVAKRLSPVNDYHLKSSSEYMKDVYNMEKMIRLLTEQFVTYWEKRVTYITPHRPDFIFINQWM